MDFLQSVDVSAWGFVALATFGAVAAVNFKWKLSPTQNYLLSVPFAFVFLFVPADFGSLIANRIKEAIAVATAINGAYQFLGGVAKKISA
jgi:hypothetical protein